MATFFTTGVPLTEEERQFKGVDYDYTKKLNPEQSMEAIKNNVITPVSNFLQTSGEKTQYNNVVNMSGVEAPSYDDIMNMSIEELSNAKNNIIQKKNNATSKSFATGYDIALQQIDRQLLSKTGTTETLNPDQSAAVNNTNVATATEDNEIAAHNAIQIAQDEDQAYNENVWNAMADAEAAITQEAEKNPNLSIGLNEPNNISKNQLEDAAILAEEGNTVSSDASQKIFDKGAGEIELEAKASATELTEEGTKTAVEKIKEELLKVMPEQEIPKELLMMKFGANLLRARSNRRGAMPKFLEELGQAIEPLTDTLIAYDLKRQEQDRALALQAYGVYEAQQKRSAKDYEYQDLFNVYATDYGPNGVLRGGSTFMGQITTPAEINYYKSMMYPSEQSVAAGQHTKEELAKTPENIQGLPIFSINKTTGKKEDFGSPMGNGIFASNPTAFNANVTSMQFLEAHIKNDAQMMQIVALGMLPGNQPQTGYGAALGKYSQVTAEKLNSLAKFLGVSEGVPILNELSGENDYREFYDAMAAAGHDFTPEGIHASISQDIQAMKQYNNQMFAVSGPDALTEEEYNLNKAYIGTMETAANELKGREGLNLMESLMQKSAFGRARYLQGSNRLLRDVIREAMDIMNVYKSGDRQMMAKLNDNITKYVEDYNDKLSFIYDPATEMDKINKNKLFVDGNYNVMGGYLNWANVNQSNPKLGDTMNLQDPDVSQDIGGKVQFQSLEEMYNSFGMELPNELAN